MELYSAYSFKALEKGLDYLWEKQKISRQNIANHETPGYKAKSISFEDTLKGVMNASPEENEARFQMKQYETKGLTIRPDGNNVNMEKESMELWESYAGYSYLTQKISGQFKNTRYVINNSFK